MSTQQPTINFTLDKTIAVICDSCGNQTFKESVLIRKVSKFVSGNAQDGIIPIPVFCCTKCGHVNDEFLPTELKTT